MDVANPTVARRELTLRVSKLLEQHGSSAQELAERLGVSASQASRLSTGARGYQPADVKELIAWLGVPPAESDRLMALADEARQRMWWQKMAISDEYRTLIGMEQSARVINEYCGNVLPGLLQTRTYGEAAAQAGGVGVTPELAAAAADRRIQRQSVLAKQDPPEFWAVIDEVALARGAGGPRVMADQLDHLIEAASRPGIHLQVIGFEYGIHTGPYSQVIVLEMPEPLPDFVYVEDKLSSSVTSPLHDAPREKRLFRSLQAIALDPAESVRRIESYRQDLYAG